MIMIIICIMEIWKNLLKRVLMNVQLNEIIKYFANATIQYADLFVTTIQPNTTDKNRKTAPKYSGLVVTLSGTANFSLNGEKYALHKGSVMHAGPGMKIEIEPTSTVPFQYIVVHYKTLESKMDFHHKHFLIETGEQNKINYFTQQLIQYEKIPGDINQLKCRTIFLKLIETVLVCAKMQTSSNVVDHAITYMAENYAQPISIAEIAEKVGCERRKLAYLFDKQIGMSPIQFLTEIRLKQSREILRRTTIPIKEIAEMVGYQDAFYYCRVFKKQYGITPSDYRKQL